MTVPARCARVVLVPGLWLTRASVLPLAWRLRRQGLDSCAVGYSSVRRGLAANAEGLAAALAGQQAEGLCFVGHSLGGLIIRGLLRRRPDLAAARVVTLGTPHRGSLVAQRLWRLPPLRPLLGRSVGDLARGEAARLGPAPAHLGCIAGSRPLGGGTLVCPGLARPHDGTVSVAEALPDEAEDCLVLPVSHTEMLFSAEVAEAVGRFLKEGRFAGRGAGDAD
jgi:pimeloyl-ACP methyl ester carboxylesterase